MAAPAALAAWTLLVWTTRIRNIWTDDALSTGEQWGRTALALSFTALAVTVVVALARRARWLRPAVGMLGAWTTAVWLVRSAGIASNGHRVAFVIVHLVLAASSIALSAWAWRSVRSASASTLGSPPRSRRRSRSAA